MQFHIQLAKSPIKNYPLSFSFSSHLQEKATILRREIASIEMAAYTETLALATEVRCAFYLKIIPWES
jgi:hypothetical protein